MPNSWWIADWYQNSPVELFSWIIWIIVSITLHELGHGWMAIHCGDDYPLVSGHMTWNPLVHIPFPWAWVMFAVFGLTWGLMPVQPSNFRGRYDEAKVAFAGPMVNLLLAVVCLVLDVAWLSRMTHVADPFHINIHIVLWTGLRLNLVLFLFNLLPVPPLDGSTILADFFPRLNELYRGERAGMFGIVAMVLLFIFGARYVRAFGNDIAEGAMARSLQVTNGVWRAPIEAASRRGPL